MSDFKKEKCLRNKRLNRNPKCDLNGDGKIDLSDLKVLVKEYNIN